jgi:hypothetical protein
MVKCPHCSKKIIYCPHCGNEFNRKLKCKRCNYEWYSKYPDKLPQVCSMCKSPYWNIERNKVKHVERANKGERIKKKQDNKKTETI